MSPLHVLGWGEDHKEKEKQSKFKNMTPGGGGDRISCNSTPDTRTYIISILWGGESKT